MVQNPSNAPINVRFNNEPKKSRFWLGFFISIIIFLLIGGGIWVYSKYFAHEQSDQTADDNSENENISHSSRDNPNGPYYHSIYLAKSDDGLEWEKTDQLIFDHASVPGAVIKDNILYVYFVDVSEDEDQLSVGVSRDDGETFKKEIVNIEGVKKYDAVDPNPILIDNKIYLFYLGDFMTMAESKDQTFTIYSAVSQDGVNFDHARAIYSANKITTDPDVFETQNDVRMLVSQEKDLTLAIEKTLNDEFIKDDDFSWNQGGVSDTIEIGDAYYTYYCQSGISVATGADKGKLEFLQTVLEEDEGKIYCDPSVVELSDGSYLMFYKVQNISSQDKNNQPTDSSNQN